MGALMSKLKNAKRERFCQEYMKDLNRTQAYIRAGYSERGAAQNAERLMRNDEVRARIADLQAKIGQHLEITQEKVLRDLEQIRDKAIKEGAFGPAAKVVELLGRHIGMWPNKIEANINLLERLNDDEQRALAAALEAIARNQGEDAEGTARTHH